MKIGEGNFSRGTQDLADKQPSDRGVCYVEHLLLKSSCSRVCVWRFAVSSRSNFLSQKDPSQKAQSFEVSSERENFITNFPSQTVAERVWYRHSHCCCRSVTQQALRALQNSSASPGDYKS